ncbi:MAG: nitroreductase [Burkholderiales bacterium]|nr:nitroreductase [Burkholderiales bacterium]
MNGLSVSDALRSRMSTRAFLPRPVPAAAVREILALAGCSPSGGNVQPWKVYALAGAERARAVEAMLAALPDLSQSEPEIAIYPAKLPDPYRTWRFECGERMYAALGITREDRAARLEWLRNNLRFFGAPVGLIVTTDGVMGEAQSMDVGIFLQSLMLLALERGLATCSQAFWRSSPRALRVLLDLAPEEKILCGVSLGYADPDHPVNRVRQPRCGIGAFVSMRGFED